MSEKSKNNQNLKRIQKIIANRGYVSRRAAEQLIIEERVKVNGKTARIGDSAPEDAHIFIDGKALKPKPKKYLMMNKPVGYVTSLNDPGEKRTIVQILKKNRIFERVMPVGRLDYDSEGLLLFTNDGDFANRIMHPRNEIKKTYEVVIDRPITNKDANEIISGIIIEGKKTSPANVQKLNSKGNKISITIHEGRNRIIRRMLGRLGYKVKNLKRTSIGGLHLGHLKTGKIRHLNDADIKLLFQKNNTRNNIR